MCAWLLLLGTGCMPPVASNGDKPHTSEYTTALSISPKEFFAARMKNYVSIKANYQLFEEIRQTEDCVFAGYISQRDKEENHPRYQKIVSCDLRQLEKEFPLFRTFTSRKAGVIHYTEHTKYDPFVLKKYQRMDTRRQTSDTDLSDTHMIFTTSYEYSGDHGPWQRFKMVTKINKTNITDVSSERLE